MIQVEEEEVEDIGEMFAAYSGKSGSIRATSRSNLNRMSPFSVSFTLGLSFYSHFFITLLASIIVTHRVQKLLGAEVVVK